MAETEPVQPSADRSAMHRHTMRCSYFSHDLVQRQVTLDSQPLAQPTVERGELALGMIALRFGQQGTARALQTDRIVHKARRHSKVPGRLTMPVPLFNARYHAASQIDRMWLTHSDPPYLPGSKNHKPLNPELLNQTNRDTL